MSIFTTITNCRDVITVFDAINIGGIAFVIFNKTLALAMRAVTALFMLVLNSIDVIIIMWASDAFTSKTLHTYKRAIIHWK